MFRKGIANEESVLIPLTPQHKNFGGRSERQINFPGLGAQNLG
jgi:hypothetical protein